MGSLSGVAPEDQPRPSPEHTQRILCHAVASQREFRSFLTWACFGMKWRMKGEHKSAQKRFVHLGAQRMRLGQPVLPKLEVRHSLS